MNIFHLDKCPIISAKRVINVHSSKMVTESAQILANCYTKQQLEFAPKSQKGNVRRYSYYNHPSCVWARESFDNFCWTLEHATALAEEKRYRTGIRHFSESFLKWCQDNVPENIKDATGLTSPALAIKGLSFSGTPQEIYQQYYVFDKQEDKNGKRMDFYTKRERPEFWFKYVDLAKYPDYVMEKK